MIKLYTIGFTGKPAETFFNILRNSQVKKIGDIFYEHNIDFAPTKELLSKYRDKKITWQEYEIEYLNLLDLRKVAQKTDIEKLHENCLLCSEHTPEKCHRRLLAEYLKHVKNEIEIIHLIK